jgi:hypothetical protein
LLSGIQQKTKDRYQITQNQVITKHGGNARCAPTNGKQHYAIELKMTASVQIVRSSDLEVTQIQNGPDTAKLADANGTVFRVKLQSKDGIAATKFLDLH